MATVTRTIPNGSTVDRIFPPAPTSGGSPTPTPTPVTFPNDTLLIDRMRVALVTEKPQILAPGWSY